MDLGKYGLLTYSTLVHPADDWNEIWDSLTRYVPRVKARMSPDQPFGVSMRIANKTAQTLTASPEKRRQLRQFFDDNNMYVYTVNAFPYGSFKNTLVKEQVYEPDWRHQDRLNYSLQVAEVLAEVSPPFVNPSIQTPPLGFKPNVTSDAVIEAYAANIRHMAAGLHRIHQRTGRIVTLAIEPEPCCFLETTPEAINFFNNWLRTDKSIGLLAHELGVSGLEANAIMLRHVGVVYDICHQAVEFENISASLQSLVDNRIPVFKLQEAAAVRIPRVTQAIVDKLRKWADTVYLTQTIEMKDGKLTRFLNLEDAFEAWQKNPGEREWRIHFHVPVFLEHLDDGIETTRFAIAEALAFHKKNPLSAQLEIETYTWDVLPPHLKSGDVVDYICQELDWVKGELA